MKLSLNDFHLYNHRDVYFYAPTEEFKKTDYYRLNQKFWCFKISKKSVFDFLHWDLEDNTHSDNSISFPEFKSKDKALFFITIALKLHNEYVDSITI